MQGGVTRVGLGLVVAALLAGCEQEVPEIPEQVRPIRTFTVAEVASGQVRKFAGVIAASDSSSLSFQIGGNVHQVLVNQGDQVEAGQTLAVLDQEPFRLNVQAADADLKSAQADLEQKRADYDRQKTLYERGWVARAAFEVAERAFRTAVTRVDYAVARLDLANRDLRNTTLAAPFDGFIARRMVDPFVEVRAGQALFELEVKGGFEAAFGVPETSIRQVVLGMPASVIVPQSETAIEALITEIGSAAGAGNAFPVKAAILEPPVTLRSGMTAEVTLLLARQDRPGGYLVPLSAVAPGEQAGQGFVFVYEPSSSTVRRTPVSSAETLSSNMVAVTGIEAGDIVATAGVNFLVDGQAVALLEPGAAGS